MIDYSQYDITEYDPYFIKGSECLCNRLGITDTAALNTAKQELSKLTMAELVAQPVFPPFDLTHLQQTHFRIFEDIYPFAGITRKVEISKGNQLFLPYHLIEEKTSECFNQPAVRKERLLFWMGGHFRQSDCFH